MSLSKRGWKEYRLGEIIWIVGGGTPKTSIQEYWNGNIPWLSVVDFNTGNKYVYKTEKTITQEGLENSSTELLNEGDIIISARGTVGALAVLKKQMAFNQSCYGIRGIPDISNQDYVYYLIKDSINNLQQIAHGGVFDTITRETFDHITIALPSLPEQRAIAGALSSLDDKIDLLRRQNKTLEGIAESLWRKMFVEEADIQWQTGKLGDFIKTTSGGTPSRSRLDYYENGTIQWVKSKELQGTFILDTEEKITEEALNNSSAKFLPKHSLLLAMYGATVGEYGILAEQATCNQAVCALLPNENYPYTFIYMFLKINKDEIINRAIGSAQQNVSQVVIQNLDVFQPNQDIINFHESVEGLFEKIKINIFQIRTLSQLRDTLLPRLMSGGVRVKNG